MLKLKDIMTRDVLTVSPDCTIRDAMELLVARHITGVPVVRDGEVVGVVSMTDLLEFMSEHDGATSVSTVAEIMTGRPLCAMSLETTVDSAADYMRRACVHRMLVMDDNRLAGIVTTTDIANAVADLGMSHTLCSLTRVGCPDLNRSSVDPSSRRHVCGRARCGTAQGRPP